MRLIIINIIIVLSLHVNSQNHITYSGNVDWDDITYQLNADPDNFYPKFTGQIAISGNASSAQAAFTSVKYTPMNEKLTENLDNSKIPETISISSSIAYERKHPVIVFSFIPYRKNKETGIIEQVTEFTIDIQYNTSSLKKAEIREYSETSVLNSGSWYKIKVDATGVFKLTYDQLIRIGLTKPGNIKIFSHGGNQLPYMNNEANYDDLVEMPILMNTGNDGLFNSGDYILFYTQGPVTWKYNSSLKMFINHLHNYSDYTYLFLTTDLGSGLRIANQSTISGTPTKTSNSFDSYRYHENDFYNLIRSGRTWYGEKFKPGESINLVFDFPQIISTSPVKIYTDVVGRREKSAPISYFNIFSDTLLLNSIPITNYYVEYTYGYNYSRQMQLASPGNSINIKYSYSGGNSVSEGYLNFVCLNARENLKFSGSPLMFRDVESVGEGNITEFSMEYTGSDVFIWDVTSPISPIQMITNSDGQNIRFTANTSTLTEYIAFNESDVLTPIIEGSDVGFIENQNLHGIGAQDMVILTNPKFQVYADELAEFHRTNDSLRVYVTTPDKIYNEFSSGTPDVAALRNFMRMLYKRATSDSDVPRYLLLFGDGSYDNKTMSSANSNYLLTYQSTNSLSETSSYVSDDFFGLLDDTEGEYLGKMDLGIGRFPVQTTEEARLMLDKIYMYLSPESLGDWRTKICFIGDDEDGGTHVVQPDRIGNSINTVNPEYNINKIYLDAYTQISTPAGQRYPDVNKAITDQVLQGALIIDYVGHGNPRILAHEEVLTIPEVRSWSNFNKLSIFVTASCEVGRFDDYARTSMGEYMLLNPNGGGIAAFTTTRVVYSGANDNLNTNFFNTVFDPNLRLGDVIRIAKALTGNDTETNKRNFSLLGDPAIKIGITGNQNYVSSVKASLDDDLNNNSAIIETLVQIDTLNALSKAVVSGYIIDKNQNFLEKDGNLYVSVFDKADLFKIHLRDTNYYEYNLQNKLLYRGQASIKDGYFRFEFIVPKDINFKYGKGKISLYAKLDSMDAIGYSDSIIIGGNASVDNIDFNEPMIQLFMNDTTFINGGSTDQNPILIAQLTDENGINTTGNGFGHNIMAIIDDNQDNVFILNNYYEGAMDKYNCGEVVYPFKDLAEGYHTLYLKAWDIYNNSSDATIEFYVKNNQDAIIENLTNFPNPFNVFTQFVFDHNQVSAPLEITIDIFDLMGNKVTQITQNSNSQSYKIDPITWYGTSANCSKLANGIYIYKITISTDDGVKTSKSSKLMIFR